MIALRVTTLVLGTLLLTACGSRTEEPTPAGADLLVFEGLSGTIDIAGGTAHIPVMQEAAKRVMRAWPEIDITIAAGGSGVGVQKVGEGLVHIGNTGRPVKEAENAKYGLVSFPFAIDGVAVVVHPSNPVQALTTEQAKAVFAGGVTNWKELGGPDKAIHLYGRDEASGTREVFWKKLLAKGDVARSANVVKSNGAMKTAVSGDEAGIGYMSIGRVDGKVAAVAIDRVAATQQNATDGSYKVVRTLFMNTKGEPAPLVKAFIDYVQSKEGAGIVAEAGYIPIRAE